MAGTYPLGSYSPGLSGYAPADFLDARESQPVEIYLDPTSTGTSTPYSQIISNVASRQMQEIKEKTVSPIPNGAAWKKRIREFLLHKNDDLLRFLRQPLYNHPTLSQAEPFMKRFGITQFSPTHHSLRDILLDASGVSLISQIEQELLTVGPATTVKLSEEVRWLYDAYRMAGEQVMKKETQLKMRLDTFDKMHQKTVSFAQLPTNDASAPLQEATMKYLEQFFKDEKIEDEYKEFMESYRRFTALREIIQSLRFTDYADKEPLCSICLAETVSFCLTPCGHTFCSSCVKRQMSNCYICRTNIKERTRIFFG